MDYDSYMRGKVITCKKCGYGDPAKNMDVREGTGHNHIGIWCPHCGGFLEWVGAPHNSGKRRKIPKPSYPPTCCTGCGVIFTEKIPAQSHEYPPNSEWKNSSQLQDLYPLGPVPNWFCGACHEAITIIQKLRYGWTSYRQND